MEESEILEFKKSTSELKEAIISIVAILNKHKKGEVYFGIRDNGDVIGQSVSDATLREISREISEHIEPKIFPKIEQILIEGRHCIKVEFEGKEIHYFAFGRVHIRTGSENRQISAKELENIILHKNKEKMRWDNQICEKASLKDIDENKVKEYLKKSELEFSSLKDSLERLEVLSDSKILNAGVLLFGKNPRAFFQSAKLRCAIFARKDTATILDRKEFEGDVLFLIEKAEEYILQNIHIGMKVEGLYRIDVPEITKEALREAIINAFCHRDYREYESVEIAIFKDRVEIRNPGGVFGSTTLEHIIKGQAPNKRRNPLIADLFKRIHFGERWGRGIKLILSKEPKTQFKDIADVFVTIFKRKVQEEKVINVSGQINEGLSEGLSEGLKLTLNAIVDHPNIKAKEISELTKRPIKTIERYVKQLISLGKIERKGSRKTGGYFVINNEK